MIVIDYGAWPSLRQFCDPPQSEGVTTDKLGRSRWREDIVEKNKKKGGF